MKSKTVSTRRLFFGKAGAVLATPLAFAAAAASERTNKDRDALQRVAELEDASAIRELQRTYIEHVNAGDHEAVIALFADAARASIDDGVCTLSAAAGQDVIELAPDRKTAAARMHCSVQVETPIEPPCPLVEMARQQGGGVVRSTGRRVLESTCVKLNGVWKLERVAYRPV